MSLDAYWSEAELGELRHVTGDPLLKSLPPPDFHDLGGNPYWRQETIGALLSQQAAEAEGSAFFDSVRDLVSLKGRGGDES